MKVVMLIPCLMLENNRKANKKALRLAKEKYGADAYVINDQMFDSSDYEEGFEYIGHHEGRAGFVNARNELLKWFYNSDYDYAFWMDANEVVSASTLNDLRTLMSEIKAGNVPVDVIFSTLGIILSSERINAKCRSDYFEKVYLTNFEGSGYEWFHGMFMVNFKKKYGVEYYVSEECDPYKGITEDVYFTKLLKKVADFRLCPTICCSKPSSKTSTWAASASGKYNYPHIDPKEIVKMVERDVLIKNMPVLKKTYKTYSYTRVDEFKELLKPYRPRAKKIRGKLL